MHTEAHLFSVPNDCLWYDKLWGPSQRVVTLFYLKKKVFEGFPTYRCQHTIGNIQGVCVVTCVMDLAIVAHILKLRRALAATTAAVRFKELLAKVV